jgi:plastocyanin
MRIARTLVLIASAALLVTVAACGGDDEDNGGAPTAGATRAASPTTAAVASPTAGGAESETLNVSAQDFSFSPSDLQATKGTAYTIALDNRGQFPHTLTVYEDEAYTQPVAGADTGRISGGESGQFVVTFSEAKDYYFRCEVHPTQMQGEIAVQ